jgi:protein gp37
LGKTSIEWTRGDDGAMGRTWNPIRGCSRVSEGCRHCYAERVAARFTGPGLAYEGLAKRVRVSRPVIGRAEAVFDPTGDLPRDEQGEIVQPRVGERVSFEARWTGEVRFVEKHLSDPLRWRNPCRVFVNSMSDLFHEGPR